MADQALLVILWHILFNNIYQVYKICFGGVSWHINHCNAKSSLLNIWLGLVFFYAIPTIVPSFHLSIFGIFWSKPFFSISISVTLNRSLSLSLSLSLSFTHTHTHTHTKQTFMRLFFPSFYLSIFLISLSSSVFFYTAPTIVDKFMLNPLYRYKLKIPYFFFGLLLWHINHWSKYKQILFIHIC